MKRFSFSLAAVLRLREHREWERELELGKAVSRCAAIESDIHNITDEFQTTVAASGGEQSVDIEFRLWQMAYMAFLEKRRGERQRELKIAEEEREQFQAQYLEAMRDRKVLTRLRERQEEVYRRNQLNHEGKVLDDITNARSARARSNIVRTGMPGNTIREAGDDGTI